VLRLPFVDTLATAPRWQKAVLGLVALAAILGLGFFIAVLPLEGRVSSLRAQRDTQQQELVRLRALAVDLTRIRREADEVERRLEHAKGRLPTQREMPALYRTLSDAAVQAGLAVALFQPREPRVRDFYSEIPISLVAEGGYHEFGEFIGRLSMLPRTTMIGEIRLTGAPPAAVRPPPGPPKGVRPPAEDAGPRDSVTGGGRPRRSVRVEMTVLTYVYRPVGSPPVPKPAVSGAKSEASKP
jgi:type IV pilus assembly protein PilO